MKMENKYPENTWHNVGQNLKNNIKTEITFLKETLQEKSSTPNSVIYIVPTIIMLTMIIYMLCKGYNKTSR